MAEELLWPLGDLHFYMRHSFKPAPNPAKAKAKAPASHMDALAGSSPFLDTAPSRLAAKSLSNGAARHTSVSGSSVASSEAEEELGRDIYHDLASFVQNGAAFTGLSPRRACVHACMELPACLAQQAGRLPATSCFSFCSPDVQRRCCLFAALPTILP